MVNNTQAQVHALFPTPVGSYSGFSKSNEFKQCLLPLLDPKQARINSQEPCLRHWFDSPGSSILEIDQPLVKELKAWILQCALDFTVRVQGFHCAGLQVISSWCNSANIGASQPPHSHENSWLSGTYYICFENGHSPIRFGAQVL